METRAPTYEDYLAAGRGELSAEEFKAAPRQPCAT